MLNRRQWLGAAGALGTLGLSACATPIPGRAQVVVVGGGYGGATAARYLRLWGGNVDVTLVERGARFTTFERVQLREITVLKTDGRRVPFDREKLSRSIRIALRKRPVEPERVERMVSGVQRQLGPGEHQREEHHGEHQRHDLHQLGLQRISRCRIQLGLDEIGNQQNGQQQREASCNNRHLTGQFDFSIG